jgi:hypothetical protein
LTRFDVLDCTKPKGLVNHTVRLIPIASKPEKGIFRVKALARELLPNLMKL